MCKKVIAMVMVVTMLVGIMVMPVSAASGPVDYNDYLVDYIVDGENEVVTVVFPSSLSYYKEKQLGPYGYGYSNFTINYPVNGNVAGALFYNYIADKLDITNIPNGSPIHFSFSADTYPIEPLVRIKVHYYDVNNSNIGQQVLFYQRFDYVVGGLTHFEVDVTKPLNKPDGAVAAYIQVELMDFYPDYAIHFHFDPLKIEMSIPAMVRLQEQTGKTNDLLKDMVEQEKISQKKMDEIIAQEQANGEKLDDIKDVIEQQPEQEKNDAMDSGDENIGEILDVIPNESEGFVNALKDFTAAMSYEGTSAVLPIPALVLPAIEGLIPETVLLDAQNFDLGSYIQMMPEWLMLLVQSLLTIALIVYCFKELYDTIAYVMTLRKGA